MWIFFLLSFVFVCLFVFFCYTLPCFLLILGDWACFVICFVVYCYLFILYFLFFTFMDFLGLFFVSLISLGTSSLRLIVFPLGGWLHGGPVSGDWYRGVVSYTNDDWESEWADYDELIDMVPRKQLTMGWEDDAWARGGVRLPLPLAGHGWTIWEMVSIALFFFLIFWKSMGIAGKVLEWIKKRFLAQLLLGWRVNFTVLSETLFLLRHRSNCGDYWCSHVVRKGGETSPKILLNCWVGVVKNPLCSDGLENGAKCSKIE